jgi:hypothetical protein
MKIIWNGWLGKINIVLLLLSPLTLYLIYDYHFGDWEVEWEEETALIECFEKLQPFADGRERDKNAPKYIRRTAGKVSNACVNIEGELNDYCCWNEKTDSYYRRSNEGSVIVYGIDYIKTDGEYRPFGSLKE